MDDATIPLGPFIDSAGYDRARALDDADPLASFRNRFFNPDPDLVYLDGNSLGRLPTATVRQATEVVVSQWGERLIRSWNEGWWDLQIKIGDQLAPLLGARPGEVIISDSTTVNLYKLAHAALKAQPERRKVVTDSLNFPTDIYVLDGVVENLGGGRHLLVVDGDPVVGAEMAIAEALDDDTALVALSHTTFRSGFTYDMARMTALAHQAGAMVLWDCSHSAGALPIDLTTSGADLAVGCTYKYINGGPGSPAFLFVRNDLQEALSSPITGWWGHAEPFAFDPEYRPVVGIRSFHGGTMPVLSLSVLEPAIEILREAGIEAIRAKSIDLTEFLIARWETELAGLGFELASPRDPATRGSQVTLNHRDAWPIARTMIETARVIPDFRPPDSLRLGLSPLYTSFLEVHTAIRRIRLMVEAGVPERYSGEGALVT